MPATRASRTRHEAEVLAADGEVRAPRRPAARGCAGPTTATVAHCSVTDVSHTRSSGHSVCSHSSIHSSTVAALPVVVVVR